MVGVNSGELTTNSNL